MQKSAFAAAAYQGARGRQEDYCGFYSAEGAVLVVLADGMGGHPGGLEAAETAVGVFVGEYEKAAKNANGAPLLSLDMLHSANAAIAAEAKKEKSLAGMGCTFIAALVRKGGMEWISVGDSLLYLFSGGRLQKLNDDHTVGGVLDKRAAEGKITPAEAADIPMRGALYSALTGRDIPLVDHRFVNFDSDDALVVAASDGLLTLTETEMETRLQKTRGKNAEIIAADLIEQTKSRRAPKQDNVTVAVVAPSFLE